MRMALIRIVFLASTISASDFPLTVSSIESGKEVLARGIEYQAIRLPGNIPLYMVSVVPNSGRVRLLVQEENIAGQSVAIRDRLPRALFLSEYADQARSLAVLSGGFMASFSPPKPLGAVRVNGRELSAPHRTWVGTGMFCTNGSKFAIGTYEALKTNRQFPD